MPYANLEIGISEVDKNEILQKIKSLQELMPYLINLTHKERRQGMKTGSKFEPLLATTIVAATTNPNFTSSAFDLVGVQTDVSDRRMLKEIHTQLLALADGVQSTFIALQQEATKQALFFYKQAQANANLNVPGATAVVQELSQYMPKKGKKKTISL